MHSVNNDDFTVLVSVGSRCHWVSMYTVWPSHWKWMSKYSNKSVSNFVLGLDIPPPKIFGWFRRLQLWTTGDWQLHHDNVPAHESRLRQFFGETSNHPGGSEPLHSPDLAPCDFWLFLKLKSPLKEKRFQTIYEIQENMTEQPMMIGRTVWGPKMPTLKGTEASFSYVQCFLYLVSSSINVSIFHTTWMISSGQTSYICLFQLRQHCLRIYYKLGIFSRYFQEGNSIWSSLQPVGKILLSPFLEGPEVH